jgi:hypothetical protein
MHVVHTEGLLGYIHLDDNKTRLLAYSTVCKLSAPGKIIRVIVTRCFGFLEFWRPKRIEFFRSWSPKTQTQPVLPPRRPRCVIEGAQRRIHEVAPTRAAFIAPRRSCEFAPAALLDKMSASRSCRSCGWRINSVGNMSRWTNPRYPAQLVPQSFHTAVLLLSKLNRAFS